MFFYGNHVQQHLYACMKHLFVTILLFAYYQAVWGQTDQNRPLLEANSKAHRYYVDLNDTYAVVYVMGRYRDVGGSGDAISLTDTLQKQPDSSYSGKQFRIIIDRKGPILISKSKRNRQFWVFPSSDAKLANNRMNNAWYLNHYFDLSDTLNKAYPLNHHSFRQGFYTWAKLPEHEKNMPYLQFRSFADQRLKKIGDSISAAQDKYTRLTDYIVRNIRTLDYTALKDSLAQLPAEYPGKSQYFGIVINAVALQQPEYFFHLAEDMPQHRFLIFSNGVDNKQAFPRLARVEGHDEMKKAFLKERKTMRTMPYVALASALTGLAFFTGILIAIF
jgi:frataxin-like iron-binding protein CyaY